VIWVTAASCDAVNAIVAAFGITLVSDFITLRQYWIRLVGGIILLVMGFGAFRAHPLADRAVKNRVVPRVPSAPPGFQRTNRLRCASN
jgi:arginine exporter protein ArgO